MAARAGSALVALVAVLLVATAVSAYAWRAVFDSEQFADRAGAALQDPDVRRAVADRVTDELVLTRQPDLLAGRPLIASAVSGIVGGEVFGSLFRHAVRDVHRAVFHSDQDTVTLTIADVGIVLAEALRQVEPGLATRLESRKRVDLGRLGSVTGDLARLAERVRWLTYVLGVLTVIAAAAALALGGDRRRAAMRLGLAVAIAGLVIAAAEIAGRALALSLVGDPDERAAAGGVWDAFLGDLRLAGWLIAASGAVVCAATASLIRPVSVEGQLRAAWRIATTDPRSTGLRVARGAVLVATGVLIVLRPESALRIAATLLGVYVLYKGLEVLLRLISGGEPRPVRAALRLRRVAVPVVAVLLAGGAVALFVAGGGVDAPAAATPAGCNGHAELCDRPLDEVALPATHNSMSVPLEGWFSSLQERPIGEQLEDGIRGLLLDTHYADALPNGRLRTFFGGSDGLRRAIGEDGVSEESVEAAKRLRARLGFRGDGERGMYLCHAFCELGATPVASVLEDIHDFLVTHPAEILVVINQDYVEPADFVDAMDDAGLTAYTFAPPSESPWPTLGELIERDQRLLVLAENRAGAAPWYQLAYERVTQETPFTFAAPAALAAPAELGATCRSNRGNDGAPLFLVNHWINSDPLPRPSNATVVNEYDVLLHRARTCQRLRAQRTNLLAVDFYTEGDVFDVVDTLNGV